MGYLRGDLIFTLVAGSTLFRSNTPLSKTLEVLMRMMCIDFLEVSVGPTIAKVVRERITANLFSKGAGADGPVSKSTLNKLTSLIESCWQNMYGAYRPTGLVLTRRQPQPLP